jgi:hypothetical protein
MRQRAQSVAVHPDGIDVLHLDPIELDQMTATAELLRRPDALSTLGALTVPAGAVLEPSARGPRWRNEGDDRRWISRLQPAGVQRNRCQHRTRRGAGIDQQAGAHRPSTVRTRHQSRGVRIRVDGHSQLVCARQHIRQVGEVHLEVLGSAEGCDGVNDFEREPRRRGSVLHEDVEVPIEGIAIRGPVLPGRRRIIQPAFEGIAAALEVDDQRDARERSTRPVERAARSSHVGPTRAVATADPRPREHLD